MNTPAEILRDFMKVITEVCGPTTDQLLPIFRQNVPPLKITARDADSFQRLCKSLELDSQLFEQVLERRRAYACLYATVYARDIFKDLTNTDFMGDEKACELHFKLAQLASDVKDTIEHCEKCILIAPGVDKPYLIAAESQANEGNFVAASLYMFKMFDKAEFDKFTLFCHLMVTSRYLANVTDPADIKNLKPYSKPSPFNALGHETWMRGLQVLHDQKDFAAFALLTTGNCGVVFEPPTYIHKLADVPGIRYQWLDIGRLLKHLRDTTGIVRSWHLRLADFVVKRGADVLSISQTFSQPLLVIATTLSVEGEVPSFLDLVWDRLDCREFDKTDRQNNTPLHAFVKSPHWKTSRMAKITLKNLLAKGCLALEKDLRGKMPHEYLPPAHQFHKLLLNTTQSPEEGLILRLEEIRKRSNEALNSNDLDSALEGYKMAARIAEKYPRCLKDEKAVLYSNMAAVHLKNGDAKEALVAIEKSLRNNAGFVKSYLRQGQAFSKLKKYADACTSFRRGFDATANQQEKFKFCMEAVNHVAKLSVERAAPVLSEMKPMLVSVWPETLRRLSADGNWTAVNLLVCGPPKFKNTGNMGIVADFMCQTADLKTISQLRSKPNFDMGTLLVTLLERSADFESLAESEGDTAFHALARLCVREVVPWAIFGNVYDLLLSTNPERKLEPGLDGEKRSLLHTVCVESQNLPDNSQHPAVSLTVLLSLSDQLGWNLDLNLRDKHSRRPIDYCRPGSHAHKLLKHISDFQKAESSSRDKASARSGSAPKPKPQQTSPSSSWQDLKALGRRAYSNDDYRQALDYYQQARGKLERDLLDSGKDLKNLPQDQSHDLAILYGNCAECHCHLGNHREFFENAKENVNYDGLWYKGHYRVARACVFIDKPKLAVQAFINSYNHLKPEEAKLEVQTDILRLLTDAAFLLKAPKNQTDEEEFTQMMKNLNLVPSEARMQLALKFIQEHKIESWKKAEFVFCLDGDRNPVAITEDLSIFCKKDLLSRQGWVCSLILQVTNLKDLIPTLKFYPQDHYLHAAVTLIVSTGASPVKQPDTIVFLKRVIDFANARRELNRQDVHGNTALHCLAQCRGPCEPMRQEVARLLIEQGIDVLVPRKDGNIVMEIISPTDSIVGHVKSATDLAIAIARTQKSNGSSGPSAKPQGPAKQGNTQTQAKSQPNLPTNVNKANPSSSSKPKSETPKDGGTKKKECDDCERYLQNANSWTPRTLANVYKDLVKIVKANHRQDGRHKMFRDESIKRIFKFVKQRDVPEIPDCIINLKAQDYKELVLMAAEDKKWTHLLALVYKFKEQKGRDALSRFAEKIAVGEVIKDANMTEASMEELVKLLVSHGGEKEEALKLSVVMEYWKVALTLLDLDANPTHLTLTEDDTPLHVAVKIALEKEPGNLDFLKKLKQLMDKSSGSHPSLDLSCQDRDGNSLLHLATKCKFSSHALAVVEMLCSWHCPVDLRDHAGYTALDYLKHNDRRAEFLRSATVPTAGAKRKTTVFSENIDKDSIASKLREKAGAMLSKLPDVIVNYIDDEPEDEEEEEEEEEEDKEKSEEEEEDAEDSDDQVYEVSDDEADVDKDMKQDTDDLDIDAKVFDDLLWDVECTEAVWNLLKGSSVVSEKDGKKLKKERLQDGMKKIVVNKIKQLASGDWRPHLQRKVHGVPDSLALHRVHLPGGACILWELAVAFSPRKSQGSSGVQASGDNPAASASGGRIYSEIIRVWSIVLHHSDLQRKVKWIVGSHRRGKDCLVQKKLKGLASSQFSGNSHSTRNPVLYMEHEVCVQREVAASQQRSLCPPASAQKNEFQILKFYSFSSALVAAILSNTSRKIDFPFRVTDLEYEMIHLESVAPILLLGRSGTGKTTCCLYRLWAKFLWYWEKAMEIGEAWLPQRNPALELQASVENEDEDEEGVEASPQASHTMATTPPPPNCEDDTASDKDDEDTDSGSDTDVDTEEEEETEQKDSSPPQEIFTHLHQLFVTKNPKLCSEVEKNFLKLRHASGTLTEHNSADIEPLPNTLQDVEDLAFPLFLTSRQLLLLLDASVEGTPYFARDEDLNLKYEIAGWGTQEDIFTIDPLDPNDWLDSDSDSDDGDKGDDAKGAAATGKKASSRRLKEESHHKFGEQRKRKTYLRRECTFEVFANEVWPKISKKAKIDCHPSLVWTEIMSFIQGSFEALGSEGGFLSLADYLTVGNKRAPNFSGNRSKVYAAFECYRKMKQDHHLFDESDLVFNIFKRLRQMNYYQPWILHEIYVDETQDFTQAELALLMCLCQDPNTMFLAGDTAQAIMRGISFRFKDLSSLFYFAAKSVDTGLRGRQNIVKVPDKVHQLRYNYRSHSGILSLASSVLDILHRFFPESFDRLHRDQGMFPGPKPVVIESCSSEDLALLLSGNQRESSHIEFGAHQAILVTNEESKAQLPEVLSAGLVLTIYEAKGLEFDDVLLYNFFADSPAGKEWRIVTEYLDDLATESSTSGGNNVIEIDSGILELPNRPRPLTFDPDQHKILSSELKHLYTAITRARVNVWIFDKDPGSRGPIFEYFKARKLVQCMDAQEDASSENFIFAQKSTAQQWRKSGDQFMSQKQFALAAKCFKHAGHQDREKLALAYQSATEASKLRAKPREMCHLYLKAGAQFVWCGDLRRAALCFQNAREHKLSALAYEKHGELETASKQYLFVPSPQEASHCLEQAGMFRKAIAVLEDSHFYDRAIDCLRRYQIKVERVESERGYVPRVLVDNRPKESQSEDNLCHRAANHHHSNKDFGRAEAAIIRLKNPSDQIVFLERNGYLEKAAELLREEGSTEKAATLMLKAGKMDRALSFAKAGFHKALEASICLAMARRKLCEDEENKEEAKFYAEEARSKFKDLGHFDGQAQARLFLGLLSQDEEDSRKFLAEAYRRFRDEVKPRHNLGEAECLLAIYHQSSENPEIKFNIEHIKTVFKALQNMIAFKLEGTPASFYGLDLHETALGEKVVFWYPAAFPRCREILGRVKKKELHEPSQGLSVDVNTATTVLMQRILSGIEPWAKQTRHELSSKVDELCDKLREDTSALNYLDHLLHLFEFDDCWMREWERLQTGEVGLQSKFSRGLLEDKESRNRALAQTLMDLLLPDSPPAWRSDGDSTRKLVMRVHRCRPALSQIQRLLRHEWNTQGRVGRGRSEDVFKERCKSTDWVVRAGLFSSLLPIWDDVGVQREVKGVERKLNEDFDRYVEWTKKSSKYALFQPKQTKNGYVIEHLSSRFVECLNNLICQQDPVDALYDFSKMLTVLGNRAMIEMMPGPKHLVFWLEVFLSTAWFVIGNAIPKEQRKPFYMSTTLAASVEVVNTCILNNNKEFWTVQQMATDSKVNRKASAIFNDRANYFIGFLAGDSRFSKFSLLGQVTRLCSAAGEENVDPVAERILVLSVVVLLNIPMGFVHESNEHLIRREFAKLSQAQGLPLKLKLLVNQVHEATTYDQVATATISYLSSQYHDTAEQPYLRSCEWHGRSTCPMMWSPLEAGNYPTGINLTPLEKVSDTEPYTNEASSPAQEYEEEESAEDQRKLEAKSESLKVEKREAWEPGAQEGRPEGEGEELSSEVDALFEKFSQITDTECDICDQDFSEARPAVSGNAGAAVSAPVSSDIPLPTQSNVNDSDLRSQHLKSHGHIEKMHQFDTFKRCYTKEIHDQLEEIKAFKLMAISKLGSSNVWASSMTLLIEDAVLTFEKTRFQLLTQRSWDKVQDLKLAFLDVTKAFEGNKRAIETKIKEQDDQEKEALAHHERMTDGFEEGIDHMDPTDAPVAAKTDGKGRGRRHGRGKFEKNLPPRFQKLQQRQSWGK